MRTTWVTRPPWGSSTPSRHLTTPSCIMNPAHLWSWCLSSNKTLGGWKRSFIMRKGYRWPLFLSVFHLTLFFLSISFNISNQRMFSIDDPRQQQMLRWSFPANFHNNLSVVPCDVRGYAVYLKYPIMPCVPELLCWTFNSFVSVHIQGL